MKTVLALSILLAIVATVPVTADAPRTISHQGLLRNADGTLVPDGDYDITFNLYDVDTGGTALWVEAHVEMPVTSGVFNVILGKMTALDMDFDATYWLGLTIEGGEELTPRVELTAAPYTFRAALADSVLGAGGFHLPYSGAASEDSGSVFSIVTMSPSGMAIGGHHDASGNSGWLGKEDAGVFGSANAGGFGVIGVHALGNVGSLGTPNGGASGLSAAGTGVHGQTSSGQGVVGEHSNSGNYGVLGATNAGVEGYGGSPGDWNLGQLGLPSEGVAGWSTDGTGVYGRTVSGQAVFGGHADSENYGVIGTAHAGVEGGSVSGVGAIGQSHDGTGVFGNTISGEAVRGEHSDSGNHGALGTAMAGVEGYGESGSGVGVYGESGAGHAGHFVGSVYVNGDVGIGTSAPARSLHVSDVLRLEPQADFPSDPADGDLCVKGAIGTYHIFCYLNEVWMQLD